MAATGTAEYLAENPETIVLGGPFSNADGDREMGVAGSQEKTAVATADWVCNVMFCMAFWLSIAIIFL